MIQKSKYVVITLLTGFAGISLFLGCGPGEQAAEPEQPVVAFWTTESYQPEEVQLLKSFAKAFEEETGTRVDIEFFTWEEINSKYLAALSAGTPPNIGQHGPDLPLRFGAEGKLIPADELVSALGKERFYEEFLDDACLYEGHYWSLPWYIEVRPLLIRKDWLDELEMEPPRTWTEWLAVCKAMTGDTDGDGEVDRWGFGLYGKDNFGQNWVAMAAQNGGCLFNEDGSVNVDAPENVEAIQWYCDLYLKHQVTPPGTKSATWTDANNYYKQGLVGSLITNGYILNELKKDQPEVLANSMFVPMPVVAGIGKSISYLGGSHLMLFKDAPHVEEAKKFIQFLYRPDNYLTFLKSTSGGTLPVFMDTAEDSYFQSDPHLRVLVGQIEGGIRHSYKGPPNPAVGAAEGERVFARPIEQILTGGKTAEEALREARERTEEIFEMYEGR